MAEKNKKILVVDDDQSVRIALFEFLKTNGYEVTVAENGHMALDMLERGSFDLVISDIRMPEMDGLELIKKAKVSWPRLPFVVVTAFATVDTAIEAMKKGAFDYILKPFPMEVIADTICRCFNSEILLDDLNVAAVKAISASASSLSGAGRSIQEKKIIGIEPAWLKVVERAKAVASSTATVLILGESGTGKEVIARYVHNESDRSLAPFIALNCAALPDGLLESELFGYEKGAFTGAIASKKGKFELADRGTLLLDEIGEVPLHLQAKLLRVLQEQEVDRLGGKIPVKFDVHVVATTNRNLSEAVEKGEFRQDLFYRLNVIPLRLPPLRERKNDIFLLADYFLKKYSDQYKKAQKKLSSRSKQRFLEYLWPGNVREMENMIERAVLLSLDNEIQPWDLWDEEEPMQISTDSQSSSIFHDQAFAEESLGTSLSDGSGSFPLDPFGQMVSLREAERQMIMHALTQTDNNRTHAAKMLGISVRTLRNKLQEYRSKGHSLC